jgi:hypothetical protein
MQSDEALSDDLSNASPSDPSSCRVNQEDVSRAGKLIRPILFGFLQTGRWLRSWLADLFCCLFRYTPFFDIEHNRGGYQCMFKDHLMGDHPWRAPFEEERAPRAVCEPQEHILDAQTWDDQRFDHVDSPCPPEPTQAWKAWLFDKFLDFPRVLFDLALQYVSRQIGGEVVLLVHWMYIAGKHALNQLRPKDFGRSDLSFRRIEDRDLGVPLGQDVRLID